jgi:hypothetical protein
LEDDEAFLTGLFSHSELRFLYLVSLSSTNKEEEKKKGGCCAIEWLDRIFVKDLLTKVWIAIQKPRQSQWSTGDSLCMAKSLL